MERYTADAFAQPQFVHSRWNVFALVNREAFGSDIRESPLVDRNAAYSLIAALRLNFRWAVAMRHSVYGRVRPHESTYGPSKCTTSGPYRRHHISLWYNTNMSMQAIQVSIDEDLLKRIDRDPEVHQRGRSAFIRSAIKVYLEAKRRQEIDEEIRRAYDGRADEMLDEVANLVGVQSWPED